MTRQRRPFLLTADTELLDELLGIAAAVGVAWMSPSTPTRAVHNGRRAAGAARRRSGRAAAAGLERRPGVVVVDRMRQRRSSGTWR